jgi:hypothetical protein
MIFSNERDDRPAHFRDVVRREKNFYFFEKSWSKMKFKNTWKKRVKWSPAIEWRGQMGE